MKVTCIFRMSTERFTKNLLGIYGTYNFVILIKVISNYLTKLPTQHSKILCLSFTILQHILLVTLYHIVKNTFKRNNITLSANVNPLRCQRTLTNTLTATIRIYSATLPPIHTKYIRPAINNTHP